MRRNPLYVFKDQNSVGIFEVPLDSVIQVVDIDGAGTPLMSLLLNKNTMDPSTTISQYLATTSAYTELDRYSEELGDLKDVVLDETINNGEVLTYDLLTDKWVNAPVGDIIFGLTLGDITDVSVPLPENNGQLLIWNETTKLWDYGPHVKELNDLIDVVSLPNDGDILVYDATGTPTWKSTNVIDGGFY